MSVEKVRPRVTSQSRVRQLPRCESCLEPMVAPEASALLTNGRVSYVWSCDRCGQSLVTSAITMA
jgi:ribosomal protein L37AE/L43A